MKAQKPFIAIICFLLILTSCGKDNEEAGNLPVLSADSLRILTSDIPGSLYTDLTFIDENVGYSISNTGLIVKTTDGGYSWEQLSSPVNFFLSRIQFTDDQTAYIIGGDATGGYLIKTTDAGQTWKATNLNTPGNAKPKGMFFLSNSVGFISGEKLFRKTTDGGQTWSEVLSDISENINDVKFITANSGFAVANNGKYLKTEDGGRTWKSLQSATSENLSKIYFTKSRTFARCAPGVFIDLGTGNKAFTAPDGANNFLFLDENRCVGTGQHWEGGYFPYGDVFLTNDAWSTYDQKKYNPQSEAANIIAAAKVREGKILMIGFGIINTSVIELRY